MAQTVFKLMHADALIELLSAMTNNDLADLGLTPDQVSAMHEVWETSCDFYEDTVGRPHPLASPTHEDDLDMPVLFVHSTNGSVN